MFRKRIILILTSRDEPDGVSQKLAEAIRKIGSHNVVVMSDDRYGSATKLSALDRLMDEGGEYQYLLEKKDKSLFKDKFALKTLSKRVNRINNLIKRFHPDYIFVRDALCAPLRDRGKAQGKIRHANHLYDDFVLFAKTHP